MFLLLSGTLKEQSAEHDTLQRHLNDAENKLTHLDKVCFCDVDFHKTFTKAKFVQVRKNWRMSALTFPQCYTSRASIPVQCPGMHSSLF